MFGSRLRTAAMKPSRNNGWSSTDKVGHNSIKLSYSLEQIRHYLALRPLLFISAVGNVCRFKTAITYMQSTSFTRARLRPKCWQVSAIPLALSGLGLVPELAFGQAAAPSQEVRDLIFSIEEIRVTGNTLLETAPLQAVLQAFLGKSKTLNDLNLARLAILEAYRQEGYELISVDYNARLSRDRIHHFTISEVKLGQITINGLKTLKAQSVRDQLPSLQDGVTPRMAHIARELFLFNDNPSQDATLVYQPTAQGTANVAINVTERSALRGEVSLNNTGTVATGEARLGLTLRHDNLLASGHQGAFSLVTSPEHPDRMQQLSLSYQIPFPKLAGKLVMTASSSKNDSGRVASVFLVSGESTSLGAQFQHSLSRTGQTHHMLVIGINEHRYRDVVDYFGTNLGASVTSRPVSLGYQFRHNNPSDSVTAALTLQGNLPGGTLNDDATYAAARAGASANWQTLAIDSSWQHRFKTGWISALRFTAQNSNSPLIASGQFGLGGQSAVRGFSENEGAGDSGWLTRIEIYTPVVGKNHRLLGFVDSGSSKRINAQPGELGSQEISSYGLGWRAQFSNGLSLAADAAVVMNGTALHPAGSTRMHILATWQF